MQCFVTYHIGPYLQIPLASSQCFLVLITDNTPGAAVNPGFKIAVPYELTAIHHDTHDTKTFCFALPDGATLDMRPAIIYMSTQRSTEKP